MDTRITLLPMTEAYAPGAARLANDPFVSAVKKKCEAAIRENTEFKDIDTLILIKPFS